MPPGVKSENGMITGIGHVAYRVGDLEASLRFYCEGLGLRKLFALERDSGETWLVYLRVTDDSFIELFPGGEEEVEITRKTRGYSHLCLHVNDIREALKRFSERGVRIEGEPKLGADGNWQHWIADPDGNRIELMQLMPGSKQSAAIAALGESTP